MAPEAVPVEDAFSPEKQDDPGVRRWMSKWSELQAWLFPQRWFRENLKLGEGGEEGIDNELVRQKFDPPGIRLFDRVDPDRLALNQVRTAASTRVTHLTYTVGKR